MRSALGLCVLGCCALGGASTASAEQKKPPTAAELEQARSAFSEGQALLAQERYEEAAEKFRAASRVKKTPGVSYHVAFSLEKAGRLLEAREEYAETARLLEASPAPDVAALLPEAQERLERDTPRLLLAGLPPSTTLTLDDRRAGLAPEIAVDPGEHTLLLEAPAHEPRRVVVTVARGERAEIDGSLTPLAPPPAYEPPPAEESGSGLRQVVFWSSTGVATLGLGAGLVGFVLERSAADRVASWGETIDEQAPAARRDSACYEPTGELEASCSGLQGAIDDHGAATTILVVGFSAFAVGTTGALLTHFLWPESSLEWSVTPLPGADRMWGGAAVHLGGSF